MLKYIIFDGEGMCTPGYSLGIFWNVWGGYYIHPYTYIYLI